MYWQRTWIFCLGFHGYLTAGFCVFSGEFQSVSYFQRFVYQRNFVVSCKLCIYMKCILNKINIILQAPVHWDYSVVIVTCFSTTRILFLWEPLCLLSKDTVDNLHGKWSGRKMKLAAHIHPIFRISMSGARLPLPHVLMHNNNSYLLILQPDLKLFSTFPKYCNVDGHSVAR
jgi:hypothetical protein